MMEPWEFAGKFVARMLERDGCHGAEIRGRNLILNSVWESPKTNRSYAGSRCICIPDEELNDVFLDHICDWFDSKREEVMDGTCDREHFARQRGI